MSIRNIKSLMLASCLALATGSVNAAANGQRQQVTGVEVNSPLNLPQIQSANNDQTQRPFIKVSSAFNLDTYRLKQIRKRLVRKQHVSYKDLRELADTGDGLAAYRFAKRLMGMGRSDILSDVAHYLSIAAYDGRSYAVRPLVKILKNQNVEFTDSRLEHLEQALLRQARSGDQKALLALAQFYEQGSPFGAKPDLAMELMKRVDTSAYDDKIALRLAASIASHQPLMPKEKEEVKRYLDVADRSDDFGIRAAAKNLRKLINLPQPVGEET